METRNDKYREYRASLIKEGSQFYTGKARTETRTLPISEVINKNDTLEEINHFNGYKAKKVILYVGIILLIIAVIAGIIVFGVYVFKE
ncbi:MAG: hypothetical protein E7178_06930 [Erysipelotrichaceae bacterium]|nr:hypothetical protein [Erysipelotrichaceae bacterium]